MSLGVWARVTVAVISLLAVGSTALSISLVLSSGEDGPSQSSAHVMGDLVGFSVTLGIYLAITVILLLRRPDNRISWLLAVFVAITALGELAGAVSTASPASADSWDRELSDWYGQWWFAAMLGCLLLLFHLFPTGHVVDGRWRWGSYSAVAAVVLVPTLMTESAASTGRQAIQLAVPARVHEVFVAAVVITWFTALIAVIPVLTVRFRQSTSVQRQQVKWFIFTVTAALVVWFFLQPTWGLFLYVAIALPAVGIAIALLRYRLYDIDRVIGRTASYVIVTGLVLATYAVVVTSVTRLMPDSSTLAVAAATLAAAALARPLLRRVQGAVDRRFNRARFDAQASVDDFGTRLRSEVDLDQVEAMLLATVDRTLQPTTLRLLGVESR